MGTRQSALALTQTNLVIENLKALCRERGWEIEFVIEKIVTKGDRIVDVTLSKVGGKGLFVKEIEQALLERKIDIAVHSMKDVPSELPEGLVIGAVPKRADPRDCLISRDGRKLDELPSGARIGTSSLRRSCQLKAHRGDLELLPVRGNIDTRLKKLESENFDAIVLAAAGLVRIGWTDRISEYLDPAVCLPAVGQGALGIECRAEDAELMELIALIDDVETRLSVEAERAFLGRLNGGCQVPIGAYAERGKDNGALRLTGMVGTPDGSLLLKETMTGGNPAELGIKLADALLARGAESILAKAGS